MMNEDTVVKIRSIAVGGDSVGEVQSGPEDLLGITAFVPFGIPGETVSVQVTEKKPKFIRAEILNIIEPSYDRIDAKCIYYKDCGGCELQHMEYVAQLEYKKEMVVGALRAARLPLEVISKVPDLQRSKPFNYRRRINLHINAQGHLGFYRAGTRNIVRIKECVIADKNLQVSIERLHTISHLLAGKINAVQCETGEDKVITVFIAPYQLSQSEVKQVSEHIRTIFKEFLIISAGKVVKHEGQDSLRLYLSKSNSVYMRVPPGGFSQVNWDMNLNLIEATLKFFRLHEPEQIYDLYAGAGNFSFPLAKENFSVVAVETEARLVSLAREVSKDQGFSKDIHFEEMSVDKFLKNFKPNMQSKLGVIADPPRSGLGALCPNLSFANCIALISCHLPSFVRDLKSLTDLGFKLESMELFDMFPQTTYLESVAFLVRD